MEAKEKAKDLVLKFAFKGAQHEGEAKTFALIAVDEILKSKELNYLFSKNLIDSFEHTSDDFYIYEEFIKYWKKVKKEIKKT
jgi:hypothetical protein